MDIRIIGQAQQIAEQAIRDAGQVVLASFDRFKSVQAKDQFGDVVTEVDYAAERIILDRLRDAFPQHAIHSEEAGGNGVESDWLWLIDPLDGTNNYAIGFPVFTVSITLMYRGRPVMGLIFEPLTGRLFHTAIGQGAMCNVQAMRVKNNADLHKATVGWIQGHAVRNEARAVKLRHYIDLSFKRMMRLWAPTLQWCMLAKGDIDGIILYNSEGDDLYAGILMVQEAGGIVVDFNGQPFTEMLDEPYLIACHPERKDDFLRIVREGLS